VVRVKPDDPASPVEGRGRFDFECWLLGHAGFPVSHWSPNRRLVAQFYFDALFPFAVLMLVSFFTRPTDPARVDLFYGKMKTPVGATPELEAAAMEETRRDPHRFDHLKLFPRSAWEFTRWNREDTLGFFGCCAISGAIVGVFLLLLRAAAT
jgi:hypothetical protein